ncbi:phosphatases II [Calocera cornea HHB12733]|uniref:protein-tyrosine-phosphatase n=1 Tax=Calocera cornea HHB12733 TaxID=1353952 RepID=A0A165F0T5_9BASI|nr:phosphatases II [Calocera cornea HHB12733]
MDVDGQTNGKLRYLKLPWSHGQQDLCEVGFNSAMHFVDRALSSGESVLIHCQCGVSRSATLVMALVIRAGHQARICGDDPEHPLCRIASHNDAYEYVQGKSRWVGPNIVLINQLVEYSKNLRTGAPPPEEALRSRTVSESTDLSQIAHEPLFSSSDSSASSSPGLASPPTPEGCVSPEMGPDSIEAMLLDKQMEAQYSKLCQQRAAAAAARAQEQQRQMQLQAEQVSPRGLGLPTAVQSPLSPASPLSASTGRPSRTRASSAESALASKTPWNIGMLLRVEEES